MTGHSRWWETVYCSICGGDFLPGDVIETRQEPDGPRHYHRACTKEGVERWIRDGRPYDSPLLYDRAERLRWYDRGPVDHTEAHLGGEPRRLTGG